MEYSRQSSLITTENFPVVHIVGCGGVGSWIALFLALAGVRTFYLWDPDTVESSNLPRTPYLPSTIGEWKAKALSDLLKSYRSDIDVTLGMQFREGHGALFMADEIVVGAVDDIETRKMLKNVSTKAQAIYYDVGAEATGFNVSSRPAEWEITPLGPRQYYTPIFVSPAAMSAAATSWLILRRILPGEFRFTEEDLKGN